MATDYDATEFVDADFESGQGLTKAGRGPTREETENSVAQKQQELAELNRKKEELERERNALEERRRRQTEFHTGREEMTQQLTRGLGLLEAAEFGARREAEQMAKCIGTLRESLTKVQELREETWTQENFNVELTRALTTVEHARMEWNAARLKFHLLSPDASGVEPATNQSGAAEHSILAGQSLAGLCRLGLALTWPIAAVGLLALGALVAVLLLKR